MVSKEDNKKEPIPIFNERPMKNTWLALQILGLALIVLLSLTAILLNNEMSILQSSNSQLRGIVAENNVQLSTLNNTITDQKNLISTHEDTIRELDYTLSIDGHILRGYRSLFFSNLTPPITKPEAVRRALDFGGWTEEKLSDGMIRATLMWVIFRQGENRIIVNELIEVTQPKADYSPIQKENLTFHYAWKVVVSDVEPTDILYWVDAATGEVFFYSTFFEPK